ncbi:hypothetical protein Tco_1027357 [Tanacetum coccineum]
MFCYFNAFLSLVKPKSYKEALMESCWIEAMQEELNECESLKVWELVPRPDRVMIITLNWIYKVKLDELGDVNDGQTIVLSWTLNFPKSQRHLFNQSKYTLESLKKYGIVTCDLVDTPVVEKSKLDEDLQGKEVDRTRYRRMIGTLMYLTSSRPDLVFVVRMCARYQAKPTEKKLHAMLLTLVAKIPEEVRLEQVENEVVELYFVILDYQLADIFTKPLGRERLAFLIDKLRMKSMYPETLKRLAEEEEE